MTTILITGGAGFIGSNFVRHMYEKYPDYRIRVLDTLTYAGSIHNLPANANSDRFEFCYGNVCNAELVDTLVSRSEVIVHMAAESHVTRSIFDNRLFFETDVMGTQTIANAVTKYRDTVRKFIHISTSEVYGSALTPEMEEDHPLNPMSPYAAAKAGADRLVYSYWQTYRIPAVIVRPFNNYGPRQHLEKVVPRFITSSLLGEPLNVHGDGSAIRDWLHVSDHCEALDRIIHGPSDLVGQTLNVGTGETLTVLDIAKAVKECMQTPSPIGFVGDRPGQVFRHTCGARRLRSLIGWEPRVRFREGLKSTVQWYKENEAWWRPQMWMRHIPIVSAAGKREMH
jgi:dTDP-glucose 4,6-dehydratase